MSTISNINGEPEPIVQIPGPVTGVLSRYTSHISIYRGVPMSRYPGSTCRDTRKALNACSMWVLYTSRRALFLLPLLWFGETCASGMAPALSSASDVRVIVTQCNTHSRPLLHLSFLYSLSTFIASSHCKFWLLTSPSQRFSLQAITKMSQVAARSPWAAFFTCAILSQVFLPPFAAVLLWLSCDFSVVVLSVFLAKCVRWGD